MTNIKLFTLLLLFPLITFAQSGPKFETTEGEDINTGSYLRGKEVVYEINFRNSGDQDLKINSVSTSCGCSSALLSNDVIKPGESGSIKFTFNGLGNGEVVKNVFVNTNETSNSNHTLVIRMKMVEPLTITPSSVISSGKVGDEIKLTITLQNGFEKEIIINEISSNSPVVKILSDLSLLSPSESSVLEISIKIYEDSPVNAAIIIKTSEGDFQIPIFVDIASN